MGLSLRSLAPEMLPSKGLARIGSGPETQSWMEMDQGEGVILLKAILWTEKVTLAEVSSRSHADGGHGSLWPGSVGLGSSVQSEGHCGESQVFWMILGSLWPGTTSRKPLWLRSVCLGITDLGWSVWDLPG